MSFKNLISFIKKSFLCLVLLLVGCSKHDEKRNLISIVITPIETKISVNETQQFTAMGIYSDSFSQDITSSVAWHSSNDEVITVEHTSGLAKGIKNGVSQITAIWNNVQSNVATINVIPKTEEPQDTKLVRIDIRVSASKILVHDSLQFKAVATYFDGHTKDVTNVVKWTSSDTKIVSIDPDTGIALGVAQGEVKIIASIGSIGSNIFPLNVESISSQQIIKIDIRTPTSKILVNQIVKFTAIATYADDRIRDVTAEVRWYSSDETKASFVKNIGIVAGILPGETQIRASLDSIDSNIIILKVEKPLNKEPIMMMLYEYIGTPKKSDLIPTIYKREEENSWTRNEMQIRGVIRDITCIDSKSCIAIGDAYNKNEVTLMVYNTHDGGKKWVSKNLGTYPATQAVINSITCNEKYCIAAGTLDFISFDGGDHWERNYIFSTNIRSISCVGEYHEFCVAVGVHYEGTTISTFDAFTSKNGGLTWSYQILGKYNDHESDLGSASCTKDGQYCVAVGSLLLNTKIQSIIYKTKEGNKDWTALALPDSFLNINLKAVTCTNNKCIFVGYEKTKTETIPVILKYDGVDWIKSDLFIKDAQYPLRVKGLNDVGFLSGGRRGILNNITCDTTGLFCTAIGNSEFYKIKRTDGNWSEFRLPFIYHSTDGGDNWIQRWPDVPNENGFIPITLESELGIKIAHRD